MFLLEIDVNLYDLTTAPYSKTGNDQVDSTTVTDVSLGATQGHHVTSPWDCLRIGIFKRRLLANVLRYSRYGSKRSLPHYMYSHVCSNPDEGAVIQ